MTDKLQIMMELDSRGALPPDKKAIFDELKSRGAIPDSGGVLESVAKSAPITFIDQMVKRGPSARMGQALLDAVGIKDKASEERNALHPTAATAGKVAGETIASIPQYAGGMGALKAIGPAKGFLGVLNNIAKGATVNAAIGQGSDIEHGVNPDRVPLDLALGGAGEALSALAPKVNAGGKWLMNKALGVTKTEAKNAIAAGKETLGSQVYERTAMPHTRAGYEKIAEKGLDKSEEALQTLLANAENGVPASKMAEAVKGLRKRYEGAGGVNIAGFENELKTIDDAVKLLSKQKNVILTAAEANSIKRKIYSIIQDKGYKASAPLPAKTNVLKTQARSLRQGIEEAAGSKGSEVASVNKDLAYYGKLKDRTADLAANSKSGNLVSKLAMTGLASAAGGGAGYAGGGKEGAIAGTLLPLALGTPIGGSAGAMGMKMIAKFLENSRFLAPFISSAKNSEVPFRK